MNKDLYIEFLEKLVKDQRQDNVQTTAKARKRVNRHPKHNWTGAEKLRLWQLHQNNYDIQQIANMMNLRIKMVENMLYKLRHENKVSL